MGIRDWFGASKPASPPTHDQLVASQRRYAEGYRLRADPGKVRVGRSFDRRSKKDLAVIRAWYESQGEDYTGLQSEFEGYMDDGDQLWQRIQKMSADEIEKMAPTAKPGELDCKRRWFEMHGIQYPSGTELMQEMVHAVMDHIENHSDD